MRNRPSNNQESEVVDEPVLQPEERSFSKEDIVYFPSGTHVWRQQGPYCVCNACELSHAVYIGIRKEMIGEDENGKPVLRDRVSA